MTCHVRPFYSKRLLQGQLPCAMSAKRSMFVWDGTETAPYEK